MFRQEPTQLYYTIYSSLSSVWLPWAVLGVGVGEFLMLCMLAEPPRVLTQPRRERTGAAVIHLPTRQPQNGQPEDFTSLPPSSLNIWPSGVNSFKIYLFMHMRHELLKRICALGQFLKKSSNPVLLLSDLEHTKMDLTTTLLSTDQFPKLEL